MPIVLQDYLMLILTVPLVDQSLQMNLYEVHNLPMLHPTLMCMYNMNWKVLIWQQ